MAETLAQCEPLHCCMTRDQGAPWEGTRSVLGEQKRDHFQWQDSCATKLGISNQAVLLVRLVWRDRADGDVTAPAALCALLYVWDPCFVVEKHRMHPWPQVLISLLYLHCWSPTKIEASFHQHRANRDNTYLNFIYSLNRQDRQRVAVETKAPERWCDMTRSPSRRLREPGIDGGFPVPMIYLLEHVNSFSHLHCCD